MRSYRETWPQLVRLGWPVTATLVVRVSMRTVDLLVIGLVIGAPGVAALGIGDAFARLVLMLALGLGAGTIATVSQHIGAGAPEDANRAVTQSAVLAGAIGVVVAICGWLAAPALFPLLGADVEVVELGVPYLQLVLASAPARMFSILMTRALQGAGDTRTPMVIRTLGTLVNIVLTVVLVTGAFGLPRFGVVGAAWGTVIGNGTSAGLLFAHLGRGNGAIALRGTYLWAPATARRIITIGAPQMLERTLYALANIPLNAIVLTFGTAANAGYQVGRRLHLYALLPSRGVATAASTYMGNHVGALEPDEGDRYGRGGASLAALVSAAIAVPLFVFAGPIASLFVRAPEAASHATRWINVFLAVTLFRAVYGALRGAMQGAGDTRSPLIASTIGIGLFTLGFSWFVGVHLGVGIAAVYLGVALDFVLRTAMLARWYHRGRWRKALPARGRATGATTP